MNQIKQLPTLCLLARRNNQLMAAKQARGFQKFVFLAAAFLGLAGLTLPVRAQTIMTMKPFRVRLEVPVGVSKTVIISNWNLRIPTNGATGVDGTGTNWVIAAVNMSLSGAPAGCTASIVGSDTVTPVTTIPVNLNTNNTAMNTNLFIELVFDGTQPSGTAELTVIASGAGLPDDAFTMPVEVARIWNGAANALVNGPGSWSDGTQWLGASAPGPNENVVFTDVGTQTNSLAGTNFLTNCVISSSTVISSLRFSQTNGTVTNNQNIFINPGVTLGIGGPDGFSMLRDYSYWGAGLMKAAIYGTNGSLMVTNESANFSILSDAQENSVLDTSGLGTLQLDVNQLHLSDYQGYPNYDCLVYTNNYSSTTTAAGKPQRFYQTWRMANTNFIKAAFADPDNYTNSLTRDYALVLGRNEASGGGSGQDVEMFMGYTNVFNLDSVCVGGSFCLGADLHFLHSGSYAIFRNTNGVDRMSIFATADAGGGGTNLWGTTLGDNTKCGGNGTGVDFTTGTVDMLVDRLYLSMDRSNVTASGKGVSQTSGFAFSAGIVDANTAILGYQSQGDQTNQSYCYATMTVSNTAVFKVNDTLALGYATASSGSPNAENNGHGQISIGPGGTVMANNITVGGVTKVSAANNITMTGGASLVVSNGIADATPGGALGTLSFGGHCTLTLFVDGSKPAVPLVYVTNLTASGTGNGLIIGGVANESSFPVDVPLIAGAGPAITPTVFDAGVTMPPGMFGTLSLSSSNTINLHIINRTPHHLLWRAPDGGTGTANWDYTSVDWLDEDTGLMTNYNNPDFAIFDDTAGFATNITVAGGANTLTPAGLIMTNNTLYYTFTDGGNQIVGGPILNKYGTGTVENDATTSMSVDVNQGSLVGSGALGGASVATGATMNYTGSLGGSLVCAGTATSSGTISGALTVSPGGVVTNAGTLSNPFAVQTNGLLVNSGTMNNPGVGSAGSPQVALGGILINGGTIGANLGGYVLFVNGTFEDLGTGTITLMSLSVGPTGTFIPGGGSSTGTTTINSDGTGNFPGAALLSQGSKTVFELNPVAPANTVLSSGHISFGASAGAQTQNGCTLVLSNISLTPFSAGQTFQLFANSELPGGNLLNTGSSTNTYPIMIPSVPGPGLVWDLRHLWIPNGSGANGVIGVVSASGGPTLTNGFTFTGTNTIGQFSWDPSDVGMTLEELITQPAVGISLTSNNWTRISGSWTNTAQFVTNGIATNDVFFRLAFP